MGKIFIVAVGMICLLVLHIFVHNAHVFKNVNFFLLSAFFYFIFLKITKKVYSAVKPVGK